mgnify:CR=1 FL=1
MKPNFYVCQECKYWDDINNCWANCKRVGDCEECFKLDEETVDDIE